MTKEELQELLYNYRHHKLDTEFWIENMHMFPPVICNDGFEVSAQANINYSCEPKEELAYWESMELCFPSQEEPLLNDYLSGWKRPFKDPYGCVPMQVIATVINKHGGLKNIEEFRGE